VPVQLVDFIEQNIKDEISTYLLTNEYKQNEKIHRFFSEIKTKMGICLSILTDEQMYSGRKRRTREENRFTKTLKNG